MLGEILLAIVPNVRLPGALGMEEDDRAFPGRMTEVLLRLIPLFPSISGFWSRMWIGF